MFEVIDQRHTSRAPFSSHPIPDAVQIALEQAATAEFAVLRTLSVRDAALVLELAAAADKALEADFDHRVEMGRWIGDRGRRRRSRGRAGAPPGPGPGAGPGLRLGRARHRAPGGQLRAAAAPRGAVHRPRRAG